MTYQEHIVQATVAAAKEAFRYAKAVPTDRLEWEPAPGSRTVLSQCRELASCPAWSADMIANGSFSWSEEFQAATKAEQSAWLTVDDCEAECEKRLARFSEVVLALSEEDLSRTLWLPIFGGKDFTFQEIADYPRWNFNYHTGQIAYIQGMYGDHQLY